MRERRHWIVVMLAAGAVSAVVAVRMRSAQEEAVRAARGVERELERGRRVEVVEVAQTLRTLRLVTVEVRTSVESSSEDESWRGDVAARVRAPVTYYYGVDLGGLRGEDLSRNAMTGGMTVRVPRPRRLATEVLGADESASVKVSGTRLRDVAGEFHLGRARTGLYDAARRAALTAEDAARLDEMTRRQVGVLVGTLSGAAHVDVVFVDAEGVPERDRGGPRTGGASAGAGEP